MVGKWKNECNNKMFEEKKRNNYRKRFVFVVGSCVHFRSFGVHNNMSAKSAIEKL